MKNTKLKKAPGTPGRKPVGLVDPVTRSLAQLDKLGIKGLREVWKRRFRRTLPSISSADVLRRLIAWKIQTEAHGDLDEQTRQRIATLMRSGKPRSNAEAAPRPGIALRAGTILVREWRGIEHRVLALDKGYEYQNRRYRSLSQVARAISGTRWSGPRFFGLEPGQLKDTLESEGRS